MHGPMFLEINVQIETNTWTGNVLTCIENLSCNAYFYRFKIVFVVTSYVYTRVKKYKLQCLYR